MGPPTARLLARIARGDRAAFTQLVATHDSRMVRLSYLVCGDAKLARDATQNAWQRLWATPPSLRDESKLGSWLLSVAANEARQLARRQRVGRLREIGAEAPSTADPDISDTPADRELLGLRYLLELSSQEIGAVLGISAEGARSRVHRLLVRLRRELADG